MTEAKYYHTIKHPFFLHTLTTTYLFFTKILFSFLIYLCIYLLTIPIALAQCDQISGIVFIDKNANGARDGGEIGLENIDVKIFDKSSRLIATQQTAHDGSYYLGNLPPSNYRVAFDSLPSWLSPSIAGPDSGTSVQMIGNDPYCTASLGLIKPICSPSKHPPQDIDWVDRSKPPLPVQPTSSIEIGNYVWEDANGNGLQDPLEKGLAGVNVSLFNTKGNLLLTVQTGHNGQYYFNNSNLPNGLQVKQQYYVVIGTFGMGAHYTPTIGLKVKHRDSHHFYSLTQYRVEAENLPYDSDGQVAVSAQQKGLAAFQGLPFVKISIENSVYVKHNCDFGFTLSNLTDNQPSVPIDTSKN